MKMSKTAALAAASRAVGAPVGERTSWQVIGPYRDTDIDGPSTTASASSYTQARAIRTRWVAQIALALMGVEDDGYIVHHMDGSARAMVDAVLDSVVV